MPRLSPRMQQPPNSTASARPRLPDGPRGAGLALVLCAVLGTPSAHAGRTDTDWMAPTRPELPMDAAGGLERLGVGRPAQLPVGGPAAAHAAMVSDMRIATHEEAQALLQGSVLPGGADIGAGTATLSALLDRLSATMPSAAVLRPQPQGVAGAYLDCALFAEDLRVQRLLGANDSRKSVDGVGPRSAVELDVPIRCMARLARTAPTSTDRQAVQPVLDQGTKATSLHSWQSLGLWLNPDGTWLMAFAGSAVAVAVFGLVARARAHRNLRHSARYERFR